MKIPQDSEDDMFIASFTRDERQATMKGTECSQHYQDYMSLVKFLCCTGCRPPKIASLQRKHITEHDSVVDPMVIASV
jgi:integrase